MDSVRHKYLEQHHHSLLRTSCYVWISQAHHHSRLRIIASLLAFGHLWHFCRYRWWTSNYPVSFELWKRLCIKPSRTLIQKTPSVRCRLYQGSSLVMPCLSRQGTEGDFFIDSFAVNKILLPRLIKWMVLLLKLFSCFEPTTFSFLFTDSILLSCQNMDTPTIETPDL